MYNIVITIVLHIR